MDARAIEEATGIAPGLINVWISRGYIPGVSVGTDRRRRNFDITTAVHIGVMSELVRLRIATDFAAAAAEIRGGNKVLLLTPHPMDRECSSDESAPSASRARPYVRDKPIVAFFVSEEALAAYFKKRGGPPTTYSVVNVGKVEEAMRRAEQEWQVRNEAAG